MSLSSFAKKKFFPETVSDWAERSILNLIKMHKTNISVNEAKIRKPNELLEAIDVSPAYSKCPGRKHKITQSSNKEEAIEEIEVVRIPPAKHSGRRTKAIQPPDDEKGVEAVETIRIPPAKTFWS
ncbi:hypothetical protein C1646_666979 [Rhizophagus diaphanus]|nr:hypothetical protein C1646_666979 [Rhizophagus diaphanus] [Rhizophagus sp. MUCL 43196]